MPRLLAASLAALLFLAQAALAGPPNILFIFSDDHAYQAISAYGDARKLIETPAIDRIAREGMRFDRCLVPNSICGPSRATVLTGLYSHRNGFFNNENSRFDGSQTTLPKLLQAAGYQTAIIGKWHLVSEPTGFDHWQILPGQGEYYHPEMIVDGKQIKEQGYVTDVITERSLEWLNKRDPKRPFFLMVQHKAPHRQWEPPLRLLGHDHDRQYPEPPTLADDFAGRGPAEHEQKMMISRDMNEGDLKLQTPKRLTAEERKTWDAYYEPRNAKFREAKLTGNELLRWRYNRYLHDYLACVRAVDDSVGRLLAALDEAKLADNTIVVYTSDQGFYLGEHGWFDKRWIFDESLRTPLVVRWPGVTEPGKTSSAMVSNLDFAPTLLAAAGQPVPGEMQGHDFGPVLRGQTPADWRKSFYYHYYEWPTHGVRPHYGVVTDRFKLVRFYTGKEPYWELFDRQTDPLELRSVWGQADYRQTQEELLAELARLRKELAVPDPDPPGSNGKTPPN
ncbi:MAG TPA: sulfatase [Pirellulales bacterium]|nr:sulfatase [Pirellulales bacterium]